MWLRSAAQLNGVGLGAGAGVMFFQTSLACSGTAGVSTPSVAVRTTSVSGANVVTTVQPTSPGTFTVYWQATAVASWVTVSLDTPLKGSGHCGARPVECALVLTPVCPCVFHGAVLPSTAGLIGAPPTVSLSLLSFS